MVLVTTSVRRGFAEFGPFRYAFLMRYNCFAFVLFLLLTACSNQPPSTNEHANHTANVANNSVTSPSPEHPSDAHGGGDHAMSSSPGAASAPFELQFLDTMIAHHKGAVEMAMLAETRAQRSELKELAASIVFDQEREIGKMAEWRNGWYDGKDEAVNMQFPGMSQGMGGMDLQKLESLKGAEFDVEFIRQMIPHHEGAIVMAKAVKASASRAELKELAEDIISAQQSEITQMKGLQ